MRAHLDRKTFLSSYLAYPESLPQSLVARHSPGAALLQPPVPLSTNHSVFYSTVAPSPPPSTAAQSPVVSSVTESLPSTASHSPRPPSSPPHSAQPQTPRNLSPQSQHDDDTRLPLPQYVLEQLTKEKMYQDKTWVGLPNNQDPKMKELDTYQPLLRILTRIASLTEEYYKMIERVRIPGKWIDSSNISLQKWSRSRVADLRPDIVFAYDSPSHEKTVGNEVEFILPLNEKNLNLLLDILVPNFFRVGGQNAAFIGGPRRSMDRLFVNALALRSCELQVYRFDRSGFVCLKKKINIHESPEDFIQVVASFSYLSPADLGWDPTCKVWDSATKSPRPSYELSQDTFRGRGVYDIPWVLEVADESFVTIGAVNGKRSLSIWGRSTFVVCAVTLVDWENKNATAKVYILKQCWQRLPGLEINPDAIGLQNSANSDYETPDQSDRDKLIQQFGEVDKKPFEEIVMERVGWTDRLKKSCMVEMNGKPITTFGTIRKGHAVVATPLKTSQLSGNLLKALQSGISTGIANSSALNTPSTPKTMQNAPNHPTLVTRTLVRLVFDRPGWPLERFMSKRELLLAVRMIVKELGLLYKKGIIHRDVSPGNLIISDSGGHIIDFDHSKIAFEMSNSVVERKEGQDVFEVALEILKPERRARDYVRNLKVLWDVEDRSATPDDFRWPMKAGPVYSFGRRGKGDGFFTNIQGTYPYLSHHLQSADFHHCTHDLDSLFWFMNSLPLTLEGPGGKKRQNPPLDIIKTYYNGGPPKKALLASSFFIGGDEWDVMTANYSDYFKDLIPLMVKWYRFVNIACKFDGAFEYHQPHEILVEIIDEAINGLGPDSEVENGYVGHAEEEKQKRQKEKDNMEKAISRQMTIAALFEESDSNTMPAHETTSPTIPASGTNLNPSPVVAHPRPSTPPAIRVATYQSPDSGRIVKMSRADALNPEST
ncbi:hypothetical protein AGABI1DRAFT_104927 [Agaricus bisporus var. burnettii JB137-S8]|uniref:Fungal-type protein kinase domain-containing protein n=1 Tax=Agaricus bisporus var. burnettii (strain JB137-S8 / ATCC MYA-4627 / FGSC 10392) TaxID=597362 RepID=K5XIA7_AGABU|nr:uncharacterized protein AGABI1DRAFT_104927 [Agaricus bisporus var. burnettii JB137-S8]EKM83213.1 hypothetical protein AGABI1DRAFT_104927 [Agaricus bisporus var. burnettii JB137-S8]